MERVAEVVAAAMTSGAVVALDAAVVVVHFFRLFASFGFGHDKWPLDTSGKGLP